MTIGGFPGAPVPQFRKDVSQRLAARGAPRNCPICGKRDWVVGELVTQNITASPLRPGYSGNPTIPFVTIWCQNCGNTVLINLLALGYSEAYLSALHLPPYG